LEKHDRDGNAFSDYGLLVHETLEKFFRDELQAFELSDYYLDNYDRMMVHPFPGFIDGKKYLEQGWQFFNNFSFDKDKYEVLIIEDKIDVDLEKYNLVVKPDLVLKDKETGRVILMDYKTSVLWKNSKIAKKDKEKLEGYKKQMNLYSKYLRTIGVNVDECWLWFVRQETDQIYKFDILSEDEEILQSWIDETVEKINEEEEFPPTINNFFCRELCSVSQFCKYKP